MIDYSVYQQYSDLQNQSSHDQVADQMEGYDQLMIVELLTRYGLPTILQWIGTADVPSCSASESEISMVRHLAYLIHYRRLLRKSLDSFASTHVTLPAEF